MTDDKRIQRGYEYARETFARLGVDTDKAITVADTVPISMQCWQGDDVVGFDGAASLTGGIAVTGNYPGRARNVQELQHDIRKAFSLIPGRKKLNLHACYALKGGKQMDRDAYTIDEFSPWVDFSKEQKIGLDFNPTYFSHPMMDGNLSLSSPDNTKRRFWVEHGKRCREIALAFAQRLAEPCVVNFWMPDGMKDTCVNTAVFRERMTRSLDEIFADKSGLDVAPCAIESKLFGVGVESYTVVSHEYALGYAISRAMMACMDTGHFHPAEMVSAKVSAVMAFVDRMLLHISRPVRWDSDHVVALDDELQRIMDEILWNGYAKRIAIGLDYFDASINRIACWGIGMRNARKALLSSALAPSAAIRQAEAESDYTGRLTLLEERKTLPLGAVWDHYCVTHGVPEDGAWLSVVRGYEQDTLRLRG